ncbi:MAG: solute carrier family 23 protein [Candidatus Izemoplasmatales bacterium]|jgi:uracil permease|nr:solute carrier family 23 protein [Candidatus Izemoplasmatales bacterium]
MSEKMLIGVREKPSKGKWVALSFQHVFAMFGATILVPILTGLPISVALFTSGVGTLIYILCTKAKVPVYLGSSFAYIGVVATVSGFAENGVGNYASAMTGLFAVGIVYVIISLLIKLVGTSWLHWILPPVVIGPMIMIIGLGLSTVAIGSSGLQGGTWQQMVVALFAFLIVVLVSIKAKGFLKVIPFLCGIVGGYILAVILGLVDFTGVKAVLETPSSWFKIPEFMFLGFRDSSVNVLGTEITFMKINLTAVLTIAPLAFVTAAEHIGDHSVLSKICDQDFLTDPGLDKTLMGDGLATAFAALVGGPANTTYGENTSVVGMTKVASVYVTGGAAVIAIMLSFVNVFTTLIASIPAPVMGGMSIILYGFIAANGMKVLIDNRVNLASMRNVIVVATMLVIGLGKAIISFGPFSIYDMSLAALVGVLLNLILPQDRARE